MTALDLDLTLSNNWSRVPGMQVTPRPLGDGRYRPMLPVSGIAPSPIVLVAGIYEDAPETWNLAGWVGASVSVNAGSTAQLIQLAQLPRQAVLLNRYSICIFQQFTRVTNYVYTFYPYRWIPTMQLEIWFYDDTVETTADRALASLLER